MPELGSGQIAIVPTFKGFRKAITAETDAAAKDSESGFKKAFTSTGQTSGRTTGSGFRKAFEQESRGFSSSATKELERAVATSSRALSQARLKEQDAAGKVRVAEKQLAEARDKYANDSSQVIRAEERLATATRQLGAAQGNTKDATDSLRSAQGRLASAADDAGEQLNQAGRRSAGRFASGFREVLTGSFVGSALGNIASNLASSIGNAVGDGFRAAGRYVQDSIGFASSLEQSIGAVDAVFKDNASTIRTWAAGAAQDVGLSRNAYQEFATVIGAQLKNLGVPIEDVTGQTGVLIGLGADLAAQFGGPTTDAVNAISAALRGERDPIERYGVSINEAAVSARLAALGLNNLTGEQEQAAKAQAVLSLLMEQTADAQGTFARESDTLAGQQARLNAEWQNAQASLGLSLLPALTSLAQVANESLVPALNATIAKVGPELGQALTDSTPALISLAMATAEYLPQLIELGTQALPIFIQGAQAIIPLLQIWTNNQTGLLQLTNALFSFLNGDTSLQKTAQNALNASGAFGDLLRGITGALGGVREFGFGVGQAMVTAASAVQNGVNSAIGFIQSLPQRASAALGDLGGLLYSSGRSLINGFLRGIAETPVGSVIGGVLSTVRGFFPNSPAKYGPFSGAGWDRLRQSGTAVMEQFEAGMTRHTNRVPVAASFAMSGGTLSTMNGTGSGQRYSGGDTYNINGITPAETASWIAAEIETKKRRRVTRTGALVTAGVS
ncbi:hypothetical protein ACIPVB_08930 [Microbacterium sp. NPDC090007]|uniref:hypothetical protein n=1 Tax=Microbacterium sp. NPDC090007 TaxID=3364204 RepID=UPI003811F5A5